MKVTKSIKNAAMITAINTFMSDWDDDGKGAEYFMDTLAEADSWEDVDGEVWEPFENNTPENIRGYIDDLYENIILIFKGVK